MIWKELFKILLALDICRIGVNAVLLMERRFNAKKEEDEEFDVYE